MDFITLFLEELDREAARSRHALEQLPENQRGWKPHDRSRTFGPLADMVATIPTWFALIVNQDSLDIAPKDPGARPPRPQPTTKAEYLAALDKAVGEARAALTATNEAHLRTHWKLLAGGTVASHVPRHQMLRDTMNHWAHHRGQMTVYLRLMGATVPALYGPSADDQRFG